MERTAEGRSAFDSITIKSHVCKKLVILCIMIGISVKNMFTSFR